MRFSREIITILFFFVGLVAFGQATDINFTAKGLAASEAYLGYHLAEQKYVQDTLEVGEGGLMKIYDEAGLHPGLYFIYVPGDIYVEFIINEPSFSIVTEGAGYDNFEVEGSPENDVFKEFQMNLGALQVKRTALSDSLQGLSGGDSLAVQQQLVELSGEANTIRDNLIEQYPDLMITKMLSLMQPVSLQSFPDIQDEEENKRQVYFAYRNSMRQRLDFTERGLLRTPVFKDQVMRYMNEVVPQVPDSLIVELDKILTTVQDDEVAFRFWLVTFTNEYQTPKLMGQDAVLVHLLEQYYLTSKADWVSEEQLETMKEEVGFLKPNLIGQPAPMLSLLDTAEAPSNPIALADEYIILFFYDPDCGHCRKKTPILRDAYADLKGLGAEVVAVCTISDQDKWRNYIKENELNWVNLADPYFKSNFRAEYNVRTTPQLYVLDRDRKIVAKKLDVDQLVDFISNHKDVVNP
ncbi:MAG: thioredoxin-like domain-containing protein [Bacteroidota bacterium]